MGGGGGRTGEQERRRTGEEGRGAGERRETSKLG